MIIRNLLKIKFLFCISSLLFLSSCFTSSSYVGKSYAPTKTVDVYVDWREVSSNYEIMGYADATPNGLSSIEDAQKKVEKLACQKGADAIVLEGMESRLVNPTVTTTKDRTPNTNGGSRTTSTTTETAQEVHTLKVTFIKYK